jgi:hypothetical protein
MPIKPLMVKGRIYRREFMPLVPLYCSGSLEQIFPDPEKLILYPKDEKY